MERKNPKDMIDIELLEAYSHFTKMYYKTKEEQGYTAGLRKEILKRMSRGQEQWKRLYSFSYRESWKKYKRKMF